MYYSKEQVTALLVSFHKDIKDFIVPVSKSSANAWLSNQDHLFTRDKEVQIVNLAAKLNKANYETNTFGSMASYLLKNGVSMVSGLPDNQEALVKQAAEAVYSARNYKDKDWRFAAVQAYELGMRVDNLNK